MAGEQTTDSTGPTLGVEEELHVIDATSGRLVSRGPEVQASFADPSPDGAVHLELTLSQVETVSSVSYDVGEAVTRTARLRSAVARAAQAVGLALLASGTPVLGDADEQQVAQDERYLALRTRAAGLVPQQLIAGMHVHVGTSGGDAAQHEVDDDARVAVADALRPWLPTLLALTANSPFWLGQDTGFACYRQVHWQRWPVAGPPPRAHDGEQWHRAVADLVATGVVEDASYVYWDVRLATRFPTVEVRVADVQATVAEAATYIALVRALASQALAGGRAAERVLDVPQHALRAAMWRAARYGLDEQLVDPLTATLRPAVEVVQSLLNAARPGLERGGDLERATNGVGQVLRDGNGAQRQRSAFARNGWTGVLDVARVDPAAPIAGGSHPSHGDGNGWVDCACGRRHWGRNGAAGLLLLRPGARGTEVLLQLRATWTHQGGTWGLPGGARDSHESISAAARREAAEETGVDPLAVLDVGHHRVDHGTWSYTYVLATAPADTFAHAANGESDAVEWVLVDEVSTRDLHPALAVEWPRVREIVRDVLPR